MEAKRDVKHTPSGNLSAQPDLASLIARYGSASSTAWTEPQYNIWREHPDAEPVLLQRDGEEQERVPGRGAVVGYLRAKDYAIAWGKFTLEL